METLGAPKYQMDPHLEHMLVSGMFSAYFELIIHEVPYENAKEYVQVLQEFYTAGWQRLMGI